MQSHCGFLSFSLSCNFLRLQIYFSAFRRLLQLSFQPWMSFYLMPFSSCCRFNCFLHCRLVLLWSMSFHVVVVITVFYIIIIICAEGLKPIIITEAVIAFECLCITL